MVLPIRPHVEFGKISNVTAFTYRDGMTHLQIQSAIRDKVGELIAFSNNLVELIKIAETSVGRAFDQYVSETIIPYEEYQEMTAALQTLRDELANRATATTDYVQIMEDSSNV